MLFQDFTKKCEKLLLFPQIGRSYEYIRQGMRGLPLNPTFRTLNSDREKLRGEKIQVSIKTNILRKKGI